MDKSPVARWVSTEHLYIADAMNRMVAMALERDDWDRLVIFEHDMIVRSDAFTRIAQYRDDVDIVGSVYFRHAAPHHVQAYMCIEEPYYSPLTDTRVAAMVADPALYPVDAVGFGLTSIHRRVLETWDTTIPMFDSQPPLVGHDLWFCTAAKRQGNNIWIDSGIVCGHLTETAIGYEDFRREHSRRDKYGLVTWDEAKEKETA